MNARRSAIAALIAVVPASGYGVLRFEGAAPGLGPLTDPGSQEADAGYSGGSSHVPVGIFSSGMLTIVNLSRLSATLDSVSLDRVSPGLTLVSASIVDRDLRCHVVVQAFVQAGPPPGSECIHRLSGFSVPPQSGWPMTPPNIEVNHLAWPVLLVFKVQRPGVFGFRGIDVHYHVGPLNYTSTYKLGLTVCTSAGVDCPYNG